MSFHVLGQRMVVLDKLPIAEMLFNSRSALYSDRPFPTMGGLLMEREKSIFMMYASFKHPIYLLLTCPEPL